MDTQESKYINPLTDFGFKYLFGSDSDHRYLLSFLNALLAGERQIESIEYVDPGHVGRAADGRAMIYDIHCVTVTGEKLIVEMQNRYQTHFRDRALYYVASDISTQGLKGKDWEYELTPVYGIFMMNFDWKEFEDDPIRKDVCLMCMESGRLFSDRIRMIFLKIPLMEKTPEQCDSDLDIWMYLFKHLEKMKEMPMNFMRNEVFRSLEESARIGALSEAQRRDYERSLKVYRDNLAIAKAERSQGYDKGRNDLIRKMAAAGMDIDYIASIAEIPATQVRDIISI